MVINDYYRAIVDNTAFIRCDHPNINFNEPCIDDYLNDIRCYKPVINENNRWIECYDPLSFGQKPNINWLNIIDGLR